MSARLKAVGSRDGKSVSQGGAQRTPAARGILSRDCGAVEVGSTWSKLGLGTEGEAWKSDSVSSCPKLGLVLPVPCPCPAWGLKATCRVSWAGCCPCPTRVQPGVIPWHAWGLSAEGERGSEMSLISHIPLLRPLQFSCQPTFLSS